MGGRLLQEHIRTVRNRLAELPVGPRLQKLEVEDNVLEMKIALDGDQSKRLNFLIYEADSYPDSGGMMMSDDDRDEALTEAINASLGDRERLTVSDVLLAVLQKLDVKDAPVLSCLTELESATSKTTACEEEDDDLAFEDDEGADDFSMYTATSVLERENRPGWKKMKWQETEEQRLLRRDELQRSREVEPGQKRRKGATVEEQRAAGQQMWSSCEAFNILSNELFSLQTEANLGLEADAVDFDVHKWTVKIRGCSGSLGIELQQLQSRFGYDYIEVTLSFKADLHPFYPPAVSVVRPRLQGKFDVLAALVCHPRLQLKGWSPFQSTKDLLLSIRRFLEQIASIDLASERNDIPKFPEGAFSPLERELVQLGNLQEIVPLDLRSESTGNPYEEDPWSQNQELKQSSLGAMLLARDRAKEQATGSQKSDRGWAAGTGYGSDFASGKRGNGGREGAWDPAAMRAAQAAKDDELKKLVGSITASVRNAAVRVAGPASSTEGGSSSSRAVPEAVGADEGEALAALLSKSCLLPFLVGELSTSYTNMGDRPDFFQAVFSLVKELLVAVPRQAPQLLRSTRQLLLDAKTSAKTFLSCLGDAAKRDDVEGDLAFARLVEAVADELERLWVQHALQPGISPSSSTSVAEDAEYCRILRAMQLDSGEIEGSHTYRTSAGSETVAPQARTIRLAKELAGLSSLLPLSGSSSVLVRLASSQQQLWRALVTGPEDTPYSGGCFVFDLYFPTTYPTVPPKVCLLTTGNNSVTFNPNLYSCGKVCLSLLGTWKGEKAESWDSVTSRAVQVLISIQSLILVPEPYFNEPGFEREIGTPHGDSRSREYNVDVREACVRWAMIDILRNPKEEFAEAIRAHFRLRAGKIKETIEAWIAEAEKFQQTAHKGTLQRLLGELEVELQKVTASDNS